MNTDLRIAHISYVIRQELPDEYVATEELIERAFRKVEVSDHREQDLVSRIRRADTFIPELSLVAANDSGAIIGHILMSKIVIESTAGERDALALAPLSVAPELQRCGVGAALMHESHRIAEKLGYGISVVLGHPGYYQRFNYCRASTVGITFPFDAPDNCRMVRELIPGSLSGAAGRVRYPEIFFE